MLLNSTKVELEAPTPNLRRCERTLSPSGLCDAKGRPWMTAQAYVRFELDVTDFRSIDDALARLDGVAGEGMDPTSVDHDASAHRETLSPDSDELDALNADDEASLAENEAEPRQL